MDKFKELIIGNSIKLDKDLYLFSCDASRALVFETTSYKTVRPIYMHIITPKISDKGIVTIKVGSYGNRRFVLNKILSKDDIDKILEDARFDPNIKNVKKAERAECRKLFEKSFDKLKIGEEFFVHDMVDKDFKSILKYMHKSLIFIR